MTLPALLEFRARTSPSRLAFADGTHHLTWETLRHDAERIAGSLLHRGVQRGDRVALCLPAGLDFVRAFFALQRIGAAPAAFDPSVPAEATARRIARIDPRLALTSLEGLEGSAPLPPIPDDPDAMAFLQPTSGTSGEPRAAVILQRNVIASLAAAQEIIDPSPRDVLVGWVPPWHDLGLLRFILNPLQLNIPSHFIAPAIRTIPLWFKTISAMRGTITGAPDFAYRLASRMVDPRDVDLTSLRYATNGGEPVRMSTIEAFESRFGVPGVILPGYGLAEATLGVAGVRPGQKRRTDARGTVSCGTAAPNAEIRIEDGEILVRGSSVFAGYYEAPEATAAVLRDGWLHTGDAGALDADGNLYVLARIRAMIKRGGAALAPRELEEAAQSVPTVRVAAAVGVPPTEASPTEEIVVVVEVDPGAESAAPALVAAAVERAIGFSPHRVIVAPSRSIPRTANGKIQHARLAKLLAEERVQESESELVGTSE